MPAPENQSAAPAGPLPSSVDPAQTRQVKELKHQSPLIGCRFDATGRHVFAAAQDNTVQRWDIGGEQPTALVGHVSWVWGMASSPCGQFLLTGSYDGQVKRWPTAGETPTPVWSAEAHRGWVRSVSVSPDGDSIASCGNDCMVRLWSAADGRVVRELAGHDCHVYNCAFHPEGRDLVSADHKGVVRHWDVSAGSLVRQLDAGLLFKYDEGFRAGCGGVRGIAFSPDGRYLACAGITEVTNAFAGVGKPVIVLFDWHTGAQKQLLRPKEDFTGVMWGVAFHPSGYVVGVGGGSSGGALWFWRPDQPQAFFALKLSKNGRGLDLHPDGLRLAVAHFDGAVRLFDMSPKPQA